MDPAAGVRRAVRLGLVHEYYGRREGNGRRRDSGSAERFRASGRDIDFLPARIANGYTLSLKARGEVIRRVLGGERGVDVARSMGVHYKAVRSTLQSCIPYLDCALNSREMTAILEEYNQINRDSTPVNALEAKTAVYLASSLDFLTEANKDLIEKLKSGSLDMPDQLKAYEVLGRNLVNALEVLNKHSQSRSGPESKPPEAHHSEGF